MNIRRLGLDQVENKCEAITSYVVARGLTDVIIGDQSAAQAVLAYYGCTQVPEAWQFTPVQQLPRNQAQQGAAPPA